MPSRKSKSLNENLPPSRTLAFPAFYREYQGLIRSVIFRITGIGEIDDLVQETFIRIWKNQKNFEGKSALKTWIYRIAVNVAIDHVRKRKSPIEYREEYPHLQENTPSPEYVNRDLVGKMLVSLSPSHRAVLTLQAIEGLSMAEIAKILELPEGTVKSKLFYAKQKALEFLNQKGVKL